MLSLVPPLPTNEDHFMVVVKDAIRKYLGERGLADVNPRLAKFNGGYGQAIIACRADAEDKFRACVAMLSEFDDKPCAVIVLRSGGTIKSLLSKRKIK